MSTHSFDVVMFAAIFRDGKKEYRAKGAIQGREGSLCSE